MCSNSELFCSFYSFRSSIERSTALLNTALILAKRAFRVIVIDFDLEAPGLSFIGELYPEGEIKKQAGVLEYLHSSLVESSALEIKQCVVKPAAFPDGCYFMPAGRWDNQYVKRLNELDLGKRLETDTKTVTQLLELFRQEIIEYCKPDIVLIDSRTGLSDEGGLCVLQITQYVFLIGALSVQNIEGLSLVKQLIESFKFSNRHYLKTFLVASQAPEGEDVIREEMFQVMHEKLGKYPDVVVPYNPRLAFKEEIGFIQRPHSLLAKAYASIADKICSVRRNEKAGILKSKAEEKMDRGDYEQALKNIDRALELIPNDPDSLFIRIKALERLGHIKAADQMRRKILKEKAMPPEKIKDLVSEIASLDRWYDELSEILNENVKIYGDTPEEPMFRLLRAKTGARIGVLHFRALEDLDWLIERGFELESDLIITRVRLLRSYNRTDEALEYLAESVKRYPEDHKLLKTLALLLADLDLNEESLRVIKHALIAMPDDEDLIKALQRMEHEFKE